MTEKSNQIAPVWALAAARATQFRRDLDDRPQRPLQTYGESLATFDAPTPESGAAAEEVVARLADLATPGLHAMAGGRFFGWVIGASHEVGVAADWLTSAWGQNAGNHSATPAAAAAEAIAAKWMLDILRLPEGASVGFVTGCTMANFACLAAARGEVLRRIGWDIEARGLFGAPPIRVLLGDEAHSTVFSALQYLGIGLDQVRKVETDSEGAILPDAFREAMDAARDEPAVIVISQAGQINTGAFDPHEEISAAVRSHPNLWWHVDGAFGLWARACPSLAHLGNGIESADSWATDGHKWLQTPYDCGYAIVRDPESHRRAMTIAASYLPPVTDGERDPSHYVPELSRRARGFATWAMLSHLGRAGIAEMVGRHCSLARQIAERLSAEDGIFVLNGVVLNQIAVRFGVAEPGEGGDARTLETIARLQQDGACFAGGAKWKGRWIMRLSVIGYPTDEENATRCADAVIGAWRAVTAD